MRKVLNICSNWFSINIFVANILNDDLPFLCKLKWDYVILSEMIEYVDYPIVFLWALHLKLQGHAKSIVLITPNGFRKDNFWFALRSVEYTNTDHRYWLTP